MSASIRGMIGDQNKIPMLMWRAQHIGQHVTASARARHEGIADRGRYRLGAVIGILRRLAGAERHLRIRCHGRHSGRGPSNS